MRLAPDGSLLFADTGNHAVRKVDPLGVISTVAGTGEYGFNGDDRPATQTQLAAPYDLEVLPDNSVLIVDGDNERIRRLEDVLPPLPQTGLLLIPEEDGQTRYVFDLTGRHLRTEDARTGQVLLTFGYTQQGQLASVTDAFGNTTTVERDAGGAPQAIVGPFGQATDLTLHPSGYLATVADPAGDAIGLTYSAEGLLTGLTDPRSNPYTFDYTPLGRLRLDSDPATGSTGLTRTELAPAGDVAGGSEVVKTSALGRTTTYRTEELTTGDTRVTVTDPAGLATVSLQGRDGSRTTTTPDGTLGTASQGPDPRFGMQAPRLETLTVTTPGGLTSTTTSSRTATFVDPEGDPKDPANVASVTDTITVNGKTATSVQDLVNRRVDHHQPREPAEHHELRRLRPAHRRRLARRRPRPVWLRGPGKAPDPHPGQPHHDLHLRPGNRLRLEGHRPCLPRGLVHLRRGRPRADADPAGPAGGPLRLRRERQRHLDHASRPARPRLHPYRDRPAGDLHAARCRSPGARDDARLQRRPPGRARHPPGRPDDRLRSTTPPPGGYEQRTPRGSYGYAYDPATGNLATATDPDGGAHRLRLRRRAPDLGHLDG